MWNFSEWNYRYSRDDSPADEEKKNIQYINEKKARILQTQNDELAETKNMATVVAAVAAAAVTHYVWRIRISVLFRVFFSCSKCSSVHFAFELKIA